MNNESHKPSRKPWVFFIIWIIILALVVNNFFYVRSIGCMRAANILYPIYLAFVIWGCIRIVRPKTNKYLLIWSIAAFVLMLLLYGPIRRNFLEHFSSDRLHDAQSVPTPVVTH